MSRTTHNQSRKAGGIYRIWIDMRTRCSNPNDTNYYKYGGRGISVCKRWDDFLAFSADIGPRPSPKHSIDRIKNEGNYEPSNCRWATAAEQAKNRRSTRLVKYNFQQMSIAEAARAAGSLVKASCATYRINRGWSVKAAVETRSACRIHPVTGKKIYRADYVLGETL